MPKVKALNAKERAALTDVLRARFEKHTARHPGLDWASILAKLDARPELLRSLHDMEQSGGEPDVVRLDEASGAYHFVDCSAESPSGRRSLCYDRAALDARKEAKPRSSAMEMAAALGVEILTEAQYRQLQKLGTFDQKTSSWVRTPDRIRALGGAIFCDRRYDTVFTYHNGAESYYAARGFRGVLTV
ncbi:MAG: DUF4256 domain-containing protein [Vicinamibacterales bacterium]